MVARARLTLASFLAVIILVLVVAAPALAWTETREVATTADGITLVFKRMRNAGAPPVILAHGLGANYSEWDLPSKSFARYLADRGYDVWLANYRNSGTGQYESDPAIGASFDEIAIFDVEAIVARVEAETGARPFWVGHSLGGMIAYAWLGGAAFERVVTHRVPYLTLAGIRYRELFGRRVAGDPARAAARNARLRGLVTIGSPGPLAWRVPAHRVNIARDSYWDYNILLTALAYSPSANAASYSTEQVPVGDVIDFLTTFLPTVPFVGAQLGPFLTLVAARIGTTPLTAQTIYGPNMEVHVLREAIPRAGEDASTVIFRQLLDGIRTSALREEQVLDTARRPYVYSDHYDRVTAPALLVAGDKDKLACDDVVRDRVFAPLGSADKTLLGVADFGHVDLVIGRRAEAGVWAPVEVWLQGH